MKIIDIGCKYFAFIEKNRPAEITVKTQESETEPGRLKIIENDNFQIKFSDVQLIQANHFSLSFCLVPETVHPRSLEYNESGNNDKTFYNFFIHCCRLSVSNFSS